MQRGKMHPDWMQWIPCSVKNWNPLECMDFMQHDWMHWIPCSKIECSGFYAVWPKASRLNTVDSMHCDWKQCNPRCVVKWIPIECSGFDAASLNADDSSHFGAMDPDFMQWGPCSVAQCIPIKCRGLYAAWPKASRLNAVDYMQHDCSSVIHYAAV